MRPKRRHFCKQFHTAGQVTCHGGRCFNLDRKNNIKSAIDRQGNDQVTKVRRTFHSVFAQWVDVTQGVVRIFLAQSHLEQSRQRHSQRACLIKCQDKWPCLSGRVSVIASPSDETAQSFAASIAAFYLIARYWLLNRIVNRAPATWKRAVTPDRRSSSDHAGRTTDTSSRVFRR